MGVTATGQDLSPQQQQALQYQARQFQAQQKLLRQFQAQQQQAQQYQAQRLKAQQEQAQRFQDQQQQAQQQQLSSYASAESDEETTGVTLLPSDLEETIGRLRVEPKNQKSRRRISSRSRPREPSTETKPATKSDGRNQSSPSDEDRAGFDKMLERLKAPVVEQEERADDNARDSPGKETVQNAPHAGSRVFELPGS
ncbi:MAG: hypothetical protein Q9162_005001 [Coniocarpon cinnabarinum]